MARIIHLRTKRRRRDRDGGSAGLRTMVWGGALLGLVYVSSAAWTAPKPAAIDVRPSAPLEAPASLRVVDGDTFWLGGEKIRIADIDTPETHPPRCAHEAELGAKATRRLEALLNEAPFEIVPIGGRDEDRYGRKLRIVTRGGRSLGDVLVAEGLARTWTGRREPWCA